MQGSCEFRVRSIAQEANSPRLDLTETTLSTLYTCSVADPQARYAESHEAANENTSTAQQAENFLESSTKQLYLKVAPA